MARREVSWCPSWPELFDTTHNSMIHNSESIILVPTICLDAADRHDTARAQHLFLLEDDGSDDERRRGGTDPNGFPHTAASAAAAAAAAAVELAPRRQPVGRRRRLAA